MIRLLLHRREPRPEDGPLVSVVVTCFDYGRYLAEAVDSALAQTERSLEVLVVDDGSTDPDTIAVLHGLSRPRTRLLVQENRGLPAARNLGLAHARGRYVCGLDADDVLEPTYVERCVERLEARRLDLAYSDVQLFGDVEEVWVTQEFRLSNLLKENGVPASAVVRRETLVRAGGYDETMVHGYEDWELWVRLAEQGARGEVVREPLFRYRKHAGSMLRRAERRHAENVAMIRDRHGRLFADAAYRRRRERAQSRRTWVLQV